jgi:hypothetical protein
MAQTKIMEMALAFNTVVLICNSCSYSNHSYIYVRTQRVLVASCIICLDEELESAKLKR